MIQIPCDKHLDSFLTFIHVQEQKIEFLCDQCLLDKENQSIKLQDLIHINQAYQYPEYIMKGLKFHEQYLSYFHYFGKGNQKDVMSKLKGLEEQISTLQDILKTVFQELSQCAKELQDIRNDFVAEFQKLIKFEEFQQSIISLQQAESISGRPSPDTIAQIKQKMISHFSYLKNDTEFQNTMFQLLCKKTLFKNLTRNKQFKHKDQFCLKTCQFQQFLLLNLQKFQLIDANYSEKLLTLIENRTQKKITDFVQVYIGTRDGLNGDSFWRKVNYKSNILIIFQSQANYIFGGYTHCQWLQYNNSYIPDWSGSSFLFSQTHDEIYPLKDKARAVYSNLEYGPCLGGIDIKISNNFNEGFDQLGKAYQFVSTKIGKVERATFLFGSYAPNIKECEVYEVKFEQD